MKSEVADGDNWLIALFEIKTVHPLRHVLFIRFLGQTPLEFLKTILRKMNHLEKVLGYALMQLLITI